MRSGALFNLIQQGTDDVTSNWYLSWARILINHASAMLMGGNPKAQFDPMGNNDAKMGILVNALVEHWLNKCNWASHQRLCIQDLFLFGNTVTKSYSELPIKLRKYKRQDGTMVQKFMRDLQRAKVGIRRRSIFKCMRSHLIVDLDDVPVSIEIEDGSWNEFALRYGNAINPNGTKKYDTGQVPVGSHYRNIHFYDEYENCYRIYTLTYGGLLESQIVHPTVPPIHELGYPIYDTPLARYKVSEDGRNLQGGVNVPGMSPLAFGMLDDQMDPDFQTYATVGMGIPQIIEGPEAIMHGLVNMAIDNERLKNTVPISYIPNSSESPSFLDLDVRTMYSGLVIDGQIKPSPLGLPNAQANQPLWEWLKFIIYQLTGVNPEPLTGDQLHTAYQSGLLVRQMNMRAKARITQWEEGWLKRAFTVFGANVLSECTVPEYEEITEDDAKRIQELIKADLMTAEDYEEETETLASGKKQTIYKKRVPNYFPVKGYKFREDFTGKNKKRTLKPNGLPENTLIQDESMQGNVSKVPADAAYLLPSGSIESIMEFLLKVDGSGMLQDLKTQDVEMYKNAIGIYDQLMQTNPELKDKVDPLKLFIRSIEPTGLTEDDVLITQQDKNPIHKAFDEAAKNIQAQVFAAGDPNAPQGMQQQPQQGQPQAQQPAASTPAYNPKTASESGLLPGTDQLNGPSKIASDLASGLK